MLTFRTNAVNARTGMPTGKCSCHDAHANTDYDAIHPLPDFSGRAIPVSATTNADLPYSMHDEMLRQGLMTPQRHAELSEARARVLARDEARTLYALPTTVPSIDTVDLSELLPPKAVR